MPDHSALEKVTRAVAEKHGAVWETLNSPKYWDELAQYKAMAQAAIDAYEEWELIETAPLDHRRILVYVPPYGPFTGHFDKEWHVAGLYVPAEPTHWKCLPPKPSGLE